VSKHLASPSRRPKIFTWHIHGTYLYYLSQANCDFYVPVGGKKAFGYGGKGGPFPFGANVHEIPTDEIPQADFDVILFQHREHYEEDQYEIFTDVQRRLPRVFLEHDPPRQHPTDTRHVVDDSSVTLVHVTDFNRLMWDSNNVPTTVIDHGVVDPGIAYSGKLAKGVVVINNLHSRGRRLGSDLFEYVRQHVPIDLIGINAEEMGGLGEVPHNQLPQFISQYRFFFNPIRYTSLGLSIIEAMMIGLPIVGFATTELVSVIESGVNGYTSLDPDTLIAYMHALLESPQLAKQIGAKGQSYARQRFNIPRFAHDWENLFADLIERKRVSTPVSNFAGVA
jgi:hypothetical protein